MSTFSPLTVNISVVQLLNIDHHLGFQTLPVPAEGRLGVDAVVAGVPGGQRACTEVSGVREEEEAAEVEISQRSSEQYRKANCSSSSLGE